jgi:RNA polymerase sigma factor (sigma-70 family)
MTTATTAAEGGAAAAAVRTLDERNALVEQWLPLVRRVVSDLARTGSRHSLPVRRLGGDAFSAGCFGLIRAAELWRPDCAASFKSYAYKAIRRRVLDEAEVWGVVTVSRKAVRGEPHLREAARRALMSRPAGGDKDVPEVERTLRRRRSAGVDAVALLDLFAWVSRVLAGVPADEAESLRLHAVDGWAWPAIGARLGCSHEGARKKALRARARVLAAWAAECREGVVA